MKTSAAVASRATFVTPIRLMAILALLAAALFLGRPSHAADPAAAVAPAPQACPAILNVAG